MHVHECHRCQQHPIIVHLSQVQNFDSDVFFCCVFLLYSAGILALCCEASNRIDSMCKKRSWKLACLSGFFINFRQSQRFIALHSVHSMTLSGEIKSRKATSEKCSRVRNSFWKTTREANLGLEIFYRTHKKTQTAKQMHSKWLQNIDKLNGEWLC